MADTGSSIITGSNTGAGAGAGAGQINNQLPIAIRTTTQSNQPTHRISLFLVFRSSIRNLYDKLCAKSALVGAIVAIVSLLLAALTLWPSFAGTADTKTATLLAEWTAKKDFFEFCESHNWDIELGCSNAKASPPGPPPGTLGPRDHSGTVSEVLLVPPPEHDWPIAIVGAAPIYMLLVAIFGLPTFRTRMPGRLKRPSATWATGDEERLDEPRRLPNQGTMAFETLPSSSGHDSSSHIVDFGTRPLPDNAGTSAALPRTPWEGTAKWRGRMGAAVPQGAFPGDPFDAPSWVVVRASGFINHDPRLYKR